MVVDVRYVLLRSHRRRQLIVWSLRENMSHALDNNF